MQHPGTDTGSFGSYWGEEEHTASVHISLMTGTEASHDLEILASEGNPASYVQADGNGNMLLAQTG